MISDIMSVLAFVKDTAISLPSIDLYVNVGR